MADSERPGAEEWVPERGGVPALRRAAPACRGCELWADATQVVFSSGDAHAALMLVGEQPGDQEDRQGEPFIGPAGRVLAEALEAAGIDRDAVYLTNAVKHFRHHVEGGGKRRIHDKPAVAHIIACRPWLTAELAAVQPRVVVCLGATAGRAVLGRTVRIQAERGRILHPDAGAGTASRAGPVAGAPGAGGPGVLITTHPSALLRLRGEAGWDEAFDGLVGDLEVAWRAAHQR